MVRAERPFIENRDGVHASNVKSKTGTAEIRAVPPLSENLCRPKRRNTSGTAFMYNPSLYRSTIDKLSALQFTLWNDRAIEIHQGDPTDVTGGTDASSIFLGAFPRWEANK